MPTTETPELTPPLFGDLGGLGKGGAEGTLGGGSEPHCSLSVGTLGNTTKLRSTPQQLRDTNYILQRAASLALPQKRVANCHRKRIYQQHAQIWHSLAINKAHYKGLQCCGSVWDCPVCAARITTYRAAEMAAVTALHRAAGGDSAFLTLTFPHYHSDVLAEVFPRVAKALRSFMNTRAVQRLLDEAGLVGWIRCLEVTHGVNGWHPHFHIVLLWRPGVDLARARIELFLVWQRVCIAAGLPAPLWPYGLALEGVDSVNQGLEAYMAKSLGGTGGDDRKPWSIELEMTKGPVKRGKRGSRTPRDLLLGVSQGVDADRVLFREYSEALHGRQQIKYSRGLKELYGVLAVEDSEIAEGGEEEANWVFTFTPAQWDMVVAHEKRAEILRTCEKFGVQGVRNVLATLAERGGACG